MVTTKADHVAKLLNGGNYPPEEIIHVGEGLFIYFFVFYLPLAGSLPIWPAVVPTLPAI